MEHVSTVPEVCPATLLRNDRDDASVTASDWRTALPVLTAGHVTLRSLRVEDAPSLHAMLSTEEVSRFISPPPTTVEAYEQFIAWAHRQQAAGCYVCFAVVPAGMEVAVGIIQLRNLEDDFRLAEWGFAIGQVYWGTGLFAAGAKLVLEFAFETLPIERLEARCAVENGRGVGALRKMGASAERLLPSGLVIGPKHFDQILWTITRASHEVWSLLDRTSPVVH
jgi:[ribosomal protein S5]-alanine N-acetyltransferase